jgi:hypothetical protein
VRAVEVIVMKVVRKVSGSVVGGVIGPGIGPLAGDGLDETFGFAIGLRPIRFGEGVFETQFLAAGSEESGAVGGATIGEDALDGDAMILVKADGLLQGIEDTRHLFVGEQTSESEAAVIINGDVQAFHPGAGIAVGAIAGGTDSGACEAAQLLDVEVEKLSRMVAFVANDRWFGGFQRAEAIEMMAAQDAGEGGLGNGEHHHDLGVGSALAAQLEDASFEPGRSLAGLMMRDGGMILEPLRESGLLGACEPAAHGFFRDPVGGGRGAQGEVLGVKMERHLRSHQGRKSGISVHVVRAGLREVECASTTSLPDASRADNVLKHDT